MIHLMKIFHKTEKNLSILLFQRTLMIHLSSKISNELKENKEDYLKSSLFFCTFIYNKNVTRGNIQMRRC